MDFTLLGTEKDSLGISFEVKKIDKISHSPIYTFFLRQQAELIDAGFSYSYTSWNDDTCGAVYAERNGEIIGHIVYDHTKYPEALWIVLSAVDEKFRKRGIYTVLHRHFELIAKDMGCWYIASHIHVKNNIRLNSAEKIGMKPLFHFMAKKIV
jgi:GNAT superfamily N-acetyltransferase